MPGWGKEATGAPGWDEVGRDGTGGDGAETGIGTAAPDGPEGLEATNGEATGSA